MLNNISFDKFYVDFYLIGQFKYTYITPDIAIPPNVAPRTTNIGVIIGDIHIAAENKKTA